MQLLTTHRHSTRGQRGKEEGKRERKGALAKLSRSVCTRSYTSAADCGTVHSNWVKCLYCTTWYTESVGVNMAWPSWSHVASAHDTGDRKYAANPISGNHKYSLVVNIQLLHAKNLNYQTLSWLVVQELPWIHSCRYANIKHDCDDKNHLQPNV